MLDYRLQYKYNEVTYSSSDKHTEISCKSNLGTYYMTAREVYAFLDANIALNYKYEIISLSKIHNNVEIVLYNINYKMNPVEIINRYKIIYVEHFSDYDQLFCKMLNPQ